MRERLGRDNTVRSTFTGIFERFGVKTNYHGYPEKTVLLKNVRNSENQSVCDHLWFNYTKQFQALGHIRHGDIITFTARVKEYTKGYVNYRKGIDEQTLDYKLSHPTKVSIWTNGIAEERPHDVNGTDDSRDDD